MSAKARALICLVGILGVFTFADEASAGYRRWYDGSRGGRHWQRRSIRLGWSPGWTGYNNRWAGYGRRPAYVRRYGRGLYGSQQYGLAMNGFGQGGYGNAYGTRAGYGGYGSGQNYYGGQNYSSGQNYNGGYGGVSGQGAASASGQNYNPGAATGGNAGGTSNAPHPAPPPANLYNENSIQQAAPDDHSTGVNSLDYGRSLSRAMDYRPASYCSFCYGGAAANSPLSPNRNSQPYPPPPSQLDRTRMLFALDR